MFVPTGFDSNDNVEVVVSGFLPNLCHRVPSSKVTVNGNKIDIKMTSLYYHASSPFCPEMVVPFVKSVPVGLLDKGKYEITVNGKTPWEQNDAIKVAESTSNAIDEFQYAYVEYIEKEEDQSRVAFKGYNPSDCFVLDKIEYVSNGKDTYSVLPIMKQVSSFCPMKMTPFTYEWTVPTDLKAQKVLLHVRTMDGHSVNTVINKMQ